MTKKIPIGWKQFRLSDLLEVRDERSPNDGVFPLCSLTIEDGLIYKPDRYIREFLVKSKDKLYKKIYKNDIVFNPMNLRWGAITVSKIDGPVIASPVYHVLYLRNTELADLSFLEATFGTRRFMNLVKTFAEGTLIERTGVSIENFLNFPIVLPPIQEQQRISKGLSDVELAINQTQAVINQTLKLKKGILQELFTNGLPGKHKHFKKTETGAVPAEWNISKIKDCVDINPEQLTVSDNPDLPIKYIDISCIKDTGIIGEPEQYILKFAPSRARRKVIDGDIIVATVRPYLRAFAYLQKCDPNLVVSTGFAVLRPKRKDDGVFIYQNILNDRFVKFLLPRMTGSNYPAVRPEDIGDYKIAIPIDQKEKNAIVKLLKSVDSRVERELAVLKQSRVLKSILTQILLTG